MTVTATLTRADTSVSFPIQEEAGENLVARDFGKPNLTVNAGKGGDLDPLMGQDVAAVNETYQINTRLGSYDTAIRLANLIKSHSQGDELTLDIPLPEYDDDIHVFPALQQDAALTLSYEPGRGRVLTSLTLSRVGDLRGQSGGDRAETPTNRSGSTGPVALRRGTDAAVAFERDIQVERAIGRPNVDISSPYQQFPNVEDTRNPSYDAFSITITSVQDATTVVSNVLDVLRTRRGRTPLTLDFQGAFNLGAFDVAEDGSVSWRQVRIGGRGGEEQSVPQLNFRVVRS
jgi:hypothetical protein